LLGNTTLIASNTNVYPLQVPSASISAAPSVSPSISAPPSVIIATLFETDCDSCSPLVAMHGNTAVVTRDYIDVQFFAMSNSGFELITKLEIDYEPMAAAINGNTTIIGSVRTGAVYVYEKDRNGTWNRVVRIQPNEFVREARFGHSVAIDQDLMVVGASGDDGSQGSVYVYRRNNTAWAQEDKLIPPDNLAADRFGWSVSVKGTSIVVGCPFCWGENNGTVSVYGFDPISSSWDSVGSTLGNNDCNEAFGILVRLTDDGGLLVRCVYDGSAVGTVYYYKKYGTGEDYVLQQIIGLDTVVMGEDYGYDDDEAYGYDDDDANYDDDGLEQIFGVYYSLAVDGKAMVVSERRGSRSNVIHFFVQKNNTWEEVASIDEPTFDKDFGERVALLGNTTLIASKTNVYPLQDYFPP